MGPVTRVIAALAWYDEQPEHLAALVTNLAEHGIDGIVALDGAYQHYPHTGARSSAEQQDAIMDTAEAAGISHHGYAPHLPWASELRKRTMLFRAAHLETQPGDWVLIIDADHSIHRSHDLHHTLHHTAADVATITTIEGHPTNVTDSHRHRLLYRHQPAGIQVERHHARYITGDGTVLRDPVHDEQQADAEDLPTDTLTLWHHPQQRTQARLQARQQYYDTVASGRLEDLR
jgi:hypothetical protein